MRPRRLGWLPDHPSSRSKYYGGHHEIFLNSSISGIRSRIWSSELKEEVVKSVAQQADGMFRVVALQLDSSKPLRTTSAIRGALSQLPSSLDIFYERVPKDIPETDQHYVKIALQWIAYTPRPITLMELSEAVVV